MNGSVRTITSLAEFLPHYYEDIGGVLLMFAMAAAVVLACVAILTFAGRKRRVSPEDWGYEVMSDEKLRRYSVRSLVEQYYELMFSGTIFLLFTALYFLMTYFGIAGALWTKYSSYILLGLIIIAVLFNSWLDNRLIPLETLRPGERETMHMMAILYMLVIFAYIKFIYQNDNYDSIIQYFILLMIGRFIGFDSTMSSIKNNFRRIINNLPLLGLALANTGLMALVGFASGYLLTPNGVVFNLFISQLYLVVIMTIVHTVRNRRWAQAEEEDKKRSYEEWCNELEEYVSDDYLDRSGKKKSRGNDPRKNGSPAEKHDLDEKHLDGRGGRGNDNGQLNEGHLNDSFAEYHAPDRELENEIFGYGWNDDLDDNDPTIKR